MTKDLHGVKIGVVSLGCAKNLVDTELMLGLAREQGAAITSYPEEADVLVVNTCAFIGPAKEESINTILDLARYKEEGKCRALIVSGCLSQRYKGELMDEIPEIDAILGTGEMDRLPEVVAETLNGEKAVRVGTADFEYRAGMPRVLTTGGHFAYVKIAEGCNHLCSFCVIPSVRGRYRSRRIEDIVEEVESLEAQGVREAILIAQDTTRYGYDVYGRGMLPELLRRVHEVRGIEWIRILYTYPTSFNDEMIETMAALDKVLNYVDLPLQHCDDTILAAMRRQGRQEHIQLLIERLRRKIPDVTLRSSFIVGFPGETDSQFQSLLKFLEEIEFDHVGVFQFSPEEDTAAATLPGQVPNEVKEERYHRAMSVQQAISRRKNKHHVGKTYSFLVDGFSEESELVMVGRTPFQAPEIDGVTYFANQMLPVGTLTTVRITEAHDYDLVGEVLGVGDSTS